MNDKYNYIYRCTDNIYKRQLYTYGMAGHEVKTAVNSNQSLALVIANMHRAGRLRAAFDSH